jgi:hypothetical protein
MAWLMDTYPKDPGLTVPETVAVFGWAEGANGPTPAGGHPRA